MLLLALRFQQCGEPRTELDHIRHGFKLSWRHRHPVVADQRSKPLPRVIFTSDLGVVRKHCRQHTALGVISSQVRRASAETTILVQRHPAAIIQGRELVHVEVHTPVALTRQLHPRAQANDRDTHTANDNATWLRAALPVGPATSPALTGAQPEDPATAPGWAVPVFWHEDNGEPGWPGFWGCPDQATVDSWLSHRHFLASSMRPAVLQTRTT